MNQRTILEASLIALCFGLTLPVGCAEEKKATPSGEGGAGGEAGAPSKPPPVVSGSGAFGVVVVNGLQKMYLPLALGSTTGHGLIAVVDVGLEGNGTKGAPALITDIELVSGDEDGGTTATGYATTTSGTSDVVIAASTQVPDVWFIDPKKDRVTKHIRLDSTAGRSSFSGGGGYVTGIAMDAAHGRAILSVWNGFAIIDLASQEIVDTIEAPPAENFGFDAKRGLIIDPFYDCSGSRDSAYAPPAFCGDFKNSSGATVTDGLAVIKLSDQSVYNYDDPTAASPRAPAAPVGREPDSAAADPNLGLVMVPSESGGFQNIIDIGHASYDRKRGFLSARDYVVQGLSLTGVAIEPESHFALLEEENSQAVAMLDLGGLVERVKADSRGAAGASGEAGATADAGLPANTGVIEPSLVHAVQASMPYLPTGASWANIGDPHGVAVTTGIADSKPVGFLVNSQRDWVARVDLTKFLALGSAPASSTAVASVADLSSAVTFLDGRTPKNQGEGGASGAGSGK